ncbi:MAG: hypothetical protein AABM67_03680 [Acidobacteriota bacterium]
MPENADRALKNFLCYLPATVDEWLIFYDSRFTKEIARRVAEAIRVREVVDLRQTRAEHVSTLDETCFPFPQIGALFFSLFHAAGSYSNEYLNAFERLNVFDTWPSNRCRIVDEVTDSTFDDVFQTSPDSLRDDCFETLDRCRQSDRARFSADTGSLDIRYDPKSGVPYTGFEPYEFNIPSGEIAFNPIDINGRISFCGWLIGSIPFGQKYGRIGDDQLILTFDNGRISGVSGSRGGLVSDLEATFGRSPALRDVKEFGIGLNTAASALARRHTVGLQWMEKCRGLHLGLGAELTEHISDHRLRRTHHHLDLVFDRGELLVGDNLILSCS